MNQASLQASANSAAGYDPNHLPVPLAQQLVRAAITPITESETLPLKQALGRILADDLVSPIAVPSHDNSAMDGYALRGSDLGPSPVTLIVVGKAFAGHPYAHDVNAGECVRIMTGAVIPRGCDSVIPHELVTDPTDTAVTIPPGRIRAGDNRRLAGEDLPAGSTALPRTRVLTPSDLGLIASLGIGNVTVMRKLRVAFFSTGDELRSVGQPLDEGCVYDSNRYTLHGMLLRAGCEPIDMGVVRDDPASLEAALRDACRQADAIITTGGVSAGDADFTREMMARLGEVLFWKIAMRPGRPMAFGRIQVDGKQAMLFGLPGNPVAVMASFYFFARDALVQMAGGAPQPLLTIRLPCEEAIRKKPGRTEFQRGIVSVDASGKQRVRITGAQGSGILSSMSEANGMIVLHHDHGDLPAGSLVDVIPFDGLL
jgi:molybdopterin molybdotransferase